MSNEPKHIGNSLSDYLRYLKGLLSNKEKHELEKRMMQDAFDQEAFEGLSGLEADELEHDMQQLQGRLVQKVERDKKQFPIFIRYVAAAILIISLGSIVYLINKPGEVVRQVAERTEIRDTISETLTLQEPDTAKQIAYLQEKAEQAKQVIAKPKPVTTAEHKLIDHKPESEEVLDVQVVSVGSSRQSKSETEDVTTAMVEEEDIEVEMDGKIYEDSDNALVEISFAAEAVPAENERAALQGQAAGVSLEEPRSTERKKSARMASRPASAFDTAPSQEVVADEEVTEESVMNELDEEPQPRMNEIKFKAYVKEYIDYNNLPEFNVARSVMLRFVITTEGEVANITVLKSGGEPFEKEAIRLLTEGPKWEPDRINGMPVEKEKTITVKIEAFKE